VPDERVARMLLSGLGVVLDERTSDARAGLG